MLDSFFYPIHLVKKILTERRYTLLTTLRSFVQFVASMTTWAFAVTLVIISIRILYYRIGDTIGLTPHPIIIAGTGSMYPTFPKGTGETPQARALEDVAAPLMYKYPRGFDLFSRHYFGYTLKRGDIVSFSNEKTTELIKSEKADTGRTTGFVKRLIALPGDTVEIRDGFVKVNGKLLSEPYTASARSTFGGQYIPDCQTVTVPEGMAVVMGDNRKGSSDTRNAIGYIEVTNIDSVLPLEKQTIYHPLWRDPTNDAQQANKTVLDPEKYLDLLNDIRSKHGVKPLKYDARLEASAKARALNMLKYSDLSFEATKSGYTPLRAMRDAGYSNITWGEAPTLGYYTAEELIENYSQSPTWEKFLLDKANQDTGIAVAVGNLNGCPVQIVVQHVAGYVPPNYPAKDIESWTQYATNLREAKVSWERARGFGGQYEDNKSDYERIISILGERVAIVTAVSARMSANRWLTDEEKAFITKDGELSKEQNTLAEKLNSL